MRDTPLYGGEKIATDEQLVKQMDTLIGQYGDKVTAQMVWNTANALAKFEKTGDARYTQGPKLPTDYNPYQGSDTYGKQKLADANQYLADNPEGFQNASPEDLAAHRRGELTYSALETPEQREIRHATIQDDLERLVGEDDLERAMLLFHSPPYQTNLDRAALDGKKVDHVPLDVHVGSIAIQRFISDRQPLVTLHGHVHESTRLTGSWRDRIGRTHLFSAAHDGPELALVRFDPDDLENATRDLY